MKQDRFLADSFPAVEQTAATAPRAVPQTHTGAPAPRTGHEQRERSSLHGLPAATQPTSPLEQLTIAERLEALAHTAGLEIAGEALREVEARLGARPVAMDELVARAAARMRRGRP